MRTTKTGSEAGPAPRDAGVTGVNDTTVLRVLAMVMICGLVTLGIPDGVRLPALTALLFCATIVTAGAAAINGDRLLAPHLNRWDETATLFMLSLLVGWLAGILDDGSGLGLVSNRW